jgi:tripartite-type tricarboxylate transporter receptor subunit TctC
MTKLRAIGLAAIVLAGCAVTAPPSLAQQDWPNRAVKIVVPFGAGGAADRLGRIAADHLSKAFKQQFYIENRVGAGGAVASAAVARADADGYTLLVGGSGPHIMGPAENPNIGYDPVSDFAHIAMIGGESFALSAQASLGVKSFKELIALSKSKAEPINCGSPGAGSLGQLLVEQIRLRKIANLNHVPYRGGAPLLTDFFGNHISVAATPVLPILQQAEAGAIVPLAVTSTERIAVLKNVPTFAELGYPDMNGAIWFWLAGPKGLPAPIVTRLNEEARRLIAAPETRQLFEKSALLSLDADSPSLTGFIVEEVKRWRAFVEGKGLKK